MLLTTVWTGPAYVQLVGEIDMSNIDALVADLLSHVEHDTDLVVDCSRLRFLDCIGASGLVEVALLIRRLRIENPTPLVRRVSRLLDLGRQTGGRLMVAPEEEPARRASALS